MRRAIGVSALLGILFAVFMACTDERLWHPAPFTVAGHMAPRHARTPCPCADLLQPVHITARRYRHPHDPTPLIMECQAPDVEAALPRSIDWPEPPLRDFRPQVDAHFDFSEPPARVYVWHEPAPMPRYRPVHVPEPPMWPLMLAGLCGVLLFRRRQHC